MLAGNAILRRPQKLLASAAKELKFINTVSLFSPLAAAPKGRSFVFTSAMDNYSLPIGRKTNLR